VHSIPYDHWVISDTSLPISEAAKQTGLSEDTLRYYERIGLTPRVEREASGHRRYSEADVSWLRFVTRMRSTGMSIETLQRYTSLLREGVSTSMERRKILLDHATSVKEKIAELTQCLGTIEHKIARLASQENAKADNSSEELCV
jgi:DNA-binding transcriptional MerR regulator